MAARAIQPSPRSVRWSGAAGMLELSVVNASAVIANLYRFDADARTEVRALVQRIGEQTQRLTQQFSPVDTGYMRDNVRLRFGPEGYLFEVGWSADDFLGQGKAFYPYFQEFGTSRMAAQPSLGPAYRQMEPRMINALRYLLQQLAARRGPGA